MQFLYPFDKQFRFDFPCEQIVRELEKRNWQVPNIIVEFHEYGSGEQKFRMVSEIKSRDFKLRFCRVQRRIPDSHWNDTAGVTEIIIPKKELHVYEDESGPRFYLYVGNNYERDREKFMNGSKVNSKLNGEPKMYLEYKGGCVCRATGGALFEAVGFLSASIMGDTEKLAKMTHSHPGRRSPHLIHTNDLGREYDPEGNEPVIFHTTKIMREFSYYLENVVLEMILSHPVATEKIDFFATPTIPFPESIGSIFCFGEYRDAHRIKQGQENIERLHVADRYGLTGSGYRLLSLDTPNDGTVPEIARDGFLWCGIGEVTPETAINSLEVPGHYRWSDKERFVIRIKPLHANGVYIADHAQYDKRRKEICDSIQNNQRKNYTNSEVADFMRARARTIIPIIEYNGGYEKPVILINRELSLDEVEVVSGPHNNNDYED